MKKFVSIFAILFFAAGLVMAGNAINLVKTGASGIPFGWEPYGHGGACRFDNNALRITTSAPQWEWGIRKTIPVKSNGKYTFSLEISRPANAVVSGTFRLMLVSGSQQGTIASFANAPTGTFVRISSTLNVFDPNVKNVTVYIFSAKQETGDFLIRNAVLVHSLK